MADDVRYSQAQLMYGDLEIVCGGFKTTFKQDSEDMTATNSTTPYDVSLGKETVEAEASDVDPALRSTIKKLFKEKAKLTLASYDFEEATGNLVEDDVLYNTYIKEIGKEDANKPFSIKFGATDYK